MIKVEVTKNHISILGHAGFADYGKDIVCAAVSSVVITTVEAIACFDEYAIDINQTNDKLEIIQNKHDKIINKYGHIYGMWHMKISINSSRKEIYE